MQGATQKTNGTGKENFQNSPNIEQKQINNVRRQKTVEELSIGYSAIEDLNSVRNCINIEEKHINNARRQKTVEKLSIGFSAIEDLSSVRNCFDISQFSFGDLEKPKTQEQACINTNNVLDLVNSNKSLITLSSDTEFDQNLPNNSESTVLYEVTNPPLIYVSFGVTNCDTVKVTTKYSSIKNIEVSHKNNNIVVNCAMIEDYAISIESDDEVCESPSPPKKIPVTVNLELKRQKSEENSILILNTDAIERLSHVIVQPPNYKLVKRQITDRNKFKKSFTKARRLKNVTSVNFGLKQRTIDSYFIRHTDSAVVVKETLVAQSGPCGNVCDDMSRRLGVADTIKGERQLSRSPYTSRKEDGSPTSKPIITKRAESPRPQNSRSQTSEMQRFRSKNKDSVTSQSQSTRKNVDAMQLSLSAKPRPNRSTTSPRIPHYKIIAGTYVYVLLKQNLLFCLFSVFLEFCFVRL